MSSFLKPHLLFSIGLLLCSLSLPLSAQQAGTLNLMPAPFVMELKEGKLRLDKNFTVGFQGNAHPRLYSSATRFLRRLDGRTGLFFGQAILTGKDNDPRATLSVRTGKAGKVVLDQDESYSLDIDNAHIRLAANTDLGALHGLETILQLVAADEQGYYLPVVSIQDSPRFAWRGLMIDVARHFLPIDVIKRNIDAMAAVKLNVLHLHLTDNQGFRVENKAYPKLHELSDGEYFTQEEIRRIVAYADDRGIRVVPEFDLPAHATAWLVGYPELGSRSGASYKLERRGGIFDPVLDPTREENYRFLEKLFQEILPLFPDEYVHIGGDENREGKDWRENPAIQAFMQKNHIADNHALQAYFNQRMLKIFGKMHKKMIGWEEILHPDLPKTAVIHSWVGKESLFRAAKSGYDTLLSEGFYIDLMYPTAEHYLNDPLLPEGAKLSAQEKGHILGGEATMWAELVTPKNVDSRIWPRTAAIAERLWSPAEIRNVDDMYRRLDVISVQLEEHGLTHLTGKQAIMRNLAGGTENTEALATLLDVVEPMKSYKRNANNDIYTMLSPFTLFADAATADARGARIFRNRMDRFLADRNAQDRAFLRDKLNAWKGNHAGILALIRISPNLKEIQALSENLKTISEIGLSIIDDPKGMSAAQYRAAFEALAAARQQGGRTELQVVDPIEKLVKARFDKSGHAP